MSMSRKGVAETFQEINNLPDKNMRIEALRDAVKKQPALLNIIVGAYDAGVVWDLPPGKVPYRVLDIVDQENMLWSEIRRLYLFVVGGHATLTALRKETLFIQLLESIMPEDAKLLCAIKDKKLPYPNITIDVVRKAFPDLLPKENPKLQAAKAREKAPRSAVPVAPTYEELKPTDDALVDGEDPLAIR